MNASRECCEWASGHSLSSSLEKIRDWAGSRRARRGQEMLRGLPGSLDAALAESAVRAGNCAGARSRLASMTPARLLCCDGLVSRRRLIGLISSSSAANRVCPAGPTVGGCASEREARRSIEYQSRVGGDLFSKPARAVKPLRRKKIKCVFFTNIVLALLNLRLLTSRHMIDQHSKGHGRPRRRANRRFNPSRAATAPK
jgi:hypothetical protein